MDAISALFPGLPITEDIDDVVVCSLLVSGGGYRRTMRRAGDRQFLEGREISGGVGDLDTGLPSLFVSMG